MHRFDGDIYNDDNGDDCEDWRWHFDDDEEEEDEEEEEAKIDENMQYKKRISTPDSSEWGTCPNCKGCGFVGNICSECNEDGMKFERHPKWY
jgi:hypothetical protein